MRICAIILLSLAMVKPCITHGQGIALRLKNQTGIWGGIRFDDPPLYQSGGRYIPSLSISDSLKRDRIIDAELSFNAYGNLLFTGSRFDTAYRSVRPYRLWLRYAGRRFELRLGLQKIDFGSATILRPMMWFDKVDYRDPLRLTEGVYGILGRYYFRNNTNVWLWALYSEDKTRGWEIAPGLEGKPEYGGRIQIPVGPGEAALSFHHREANYEQFYALIPHTGATHFPENKVGFDGKWDIGPGIWTEYVLKINDPDNGIVKKWESYLNLGIDYTFNIGNGIHIMTEYFRYNNREDWKESSGDATSYSTVVIDYPFGLMNRIAGIAYYNWNKKEWYRMINIERQWDHLSLYLMAFWNSESAFLYSREGETNLFAGTGVQLMAIMNF